MQHLCDSCSCLPLSLMGIHDRESTASTSTTYFMLCITQTAVMKQSVAWEPIFQISACVCPYSHPQNTVTNLPQARQWSLSSHTLAIKHEEFHASS